MEEVGDAVVFQATDLYHLFLQKFQISASEQLVSRSIGIGDMECYNSRFSVICFEEVGQKPKNKSV
jgi:hypothetical protein